MLMKEGLLFFIAIILFNYMNNECQAFQCYSCSDCNNATQSTWDLIQTMNPNDQCIRTTIVTRNNNNQGRVIINRGASDRCKTYSDTDGRISIYCCNTTLCNN